MNDRDRLAVDLRDAAGAFADDPAAYLDRGDAYDAMADRLIALGWTRLDVTPTQLSEREVTSDRAACNHISQPRLDEERLARALGPLRALIDEDGADRAHPTWHDDAVEALAAIAKAYREDTDG